MPTFAACGPEQANTSRPGRINDVPHRNCEGDAQGGSRAARPRRKQRLGLGASDAAQPQLSEASPGRRTNGTPFGPPGISLGILGETAFSERACLVVDCGENNSRLRKAGLSTVACIRETVRPARRRRKATFQRESSRCAVTGKLVLWAKTPERKNAKPTGKEAALLRC